MKPSHLILALIVIFFSCCQKKEHAEEGSPDWFKPDYGPSLHVMGRSSLWDAQHKELGNTGFKAAIGSNTYQDEKNIDPDSYSIDVEYKQKNSSLVCFSRDFEISDLPTGFLDKKIDDVVTYNSNTRKVTFTIGDKEHIYILPQTK